MVSENLNKTFGRYKIISKAGKGGMAVVYKARDPVLGRTVALKVDKKKIDGKVVKDQKSLSACLKEARLAAQFIHPNIAITYDAGFANNRFFIALEFIDGAGLQIHSKRDNRLSVIKVLEIIYNVCHALSYIHQKGCVHLDIKPSNIMMTSEGEVKLMDFGIAHILSENREKTSNKIQGTIFYMSPEQASGNKKLDARSDIYSLGVVMYELLTAKRPFTGDDFYQIIYQIVNKEPESIINYVPDISPQIDKIVQKAMNKDPEKRFKSSKLFADALHEVIKGSDSTVLNKLDKKKLSLLKRIKIFTHFQDSDFSELIKISSWKHYEQSAWIIDEGIGSISNIYIVIIGKVLVFLGEDIKILKQGEFFGDTSVLYDIKSQIKIMADMDCVIMIINANLLNKAPDSLQVKFLREFYKNKTLQLVETNLKIIQQKL